MVLVGMVIVFTIICGTQFFSGSNLLTILNQMALPLVVALGLTFVIMLGSIDLSIDGTVGMAGSLFACFVLVLPALVRVKNQIRPIRYGFIGLLQHGSHHVQNRTFRNRIADQIAIM